MSDMSLTIDITGIGPDQLLFAVSPLAELTAMLHVLATPAHHTAHRSWAAAVRAELAPELARQLLEAEFLWEATRADFLLPGLAGQTLEQELDAVEQIDDERYVTAALTPTCGADRPQPGPPSPLADAAAKERALKLAQARGPRQADFAARLIADPPTVRTRIRRMLQDCGPAFFDRTWQRIRPQLMADVRHKADLLARRGLSTMLTGVSRAVTLDDTGGHIVIDKLQDSSTSAVPGGMTFVPSFFGRPHLVAVHARGWRPVVQYPIADPGMDEAVPLELVRLRLEALSHPMRLRLLRTLARGSFTTGELALAWELTTPEVSRHLAMLRRADLLRTERRGRYVRYELDTSVITSLGEDLLQALLR
jgi:DNA-binding transcriptional ArsR family regulator